MIDAGDEAALDGFFALSADLLALASSGEGWRKISRSFEQSLGWSEQDLRGAPADGLVHPNDRSSFAAALEQEGLAGSVRDLVCRMQDKAGGWRRIAWRMAPGKDGLVCCVGREVDGETIPPGSAAAADRASDSVAERRHRLGNLIAVVQALATESARSSSTFEDFRRTFSDRLASIVRAQDLLLRADDGDRISFQELIVSELEAAGLLDRVTGDETVVLGGPADVLVPSKALQMLALTLHELAADAARNGALSRPGGRLQVSWTLVSPGGGSKAALCVEWSEIGLSSAPRGEFGRELVEDALPFQLSEETLYESSPDGLRCVITLRPL